MCHSNLKISIILCTYNGSQYLETQVNSLLTQSMLPHEIIISDDCSNDQTVNMIQSLLNRSGIKCHITVNTSNLGAMNNFSNAMEQATGDLMIFSDQDDYWYSNKIETIYQHYIKEQNKSLPWLIYSDAEVFDNNDRLIAPSLMSYAGLKPRTDGQHLQFLLANSVFGCTMAINRALLEEALPIHKYALMHDWWCAAIAAHIGKVVYLDDKLIKYRVHNSNTIGVKNFQSSLSLFLVNPLKQLNKFVINYTLCLRQANQLQQTILSKGHKVQEEQLLVIQNLQRSGISRFLPFISGKVYRHSIIGLLTFLYAAIFTVHKDLSNYDA